MNSVLLKGFIREAHNVTWIGPNPFRSGLCWGLDNGSIVLDQDGGKPYAGFTASENHEAVNAVAGVAPGWLAISTRSDVTFVNLAKPYPARFAGGAHGVIATPGGCFVAPLGMNGVLTVVPADGTEQVMHVMTPKQDRAYFYRVAAVRTAHGKELVAFAIRRGGLAITSIAGGEMTEKVHATTFDGLDVVDVCGVSHESHALIAVSPKGEILWVNDASARNDPIASRLGGIVGKVYRVLATQRHLFLLTSKALYVLVDLVGKYLFGEALSPFAHPLVFPVEAVDMAMIDDRLYLLSANEVMAVQIRDLVRQPADSGSSAELANSAVFEDFEPAWEQRLVATT